MALPRRRWWWGFTEVERASAGKRGTIIAKCWFVDKD